MSEAHNDKVMELDFQNLKALVARQRSAFRAEGDVTYATRIDRLKRPKALIVENKTEFATTTKREFNGARTLSLTHISEPTRLRRNA